MLRTRFVIIGASVGIGSALSRRLKSHGAQPILPGGSGAKLALLGEELGATSKADELEHAVAAFDAINGIVNWNRVASASRLR